MKYLSIGSQKLSEFKKYDYIYVDKTELIYKLITTGRYYFLSRPRRFGKSLLVDTLKEIFSGNRELFKGLWIEDKWDFEEHPVIHLDFTKLPYKEQGLKKALEIFLNETARKHKINYIQPDYSGKFLELIEKTGKEKEVAILIDEYDKPIIDYLENDKLKQAEENRELLKNFYSGIKAQGRFIRFLFITGVSKFSKVSIFSDLNNLEDITTAKDYSKLLGYTEQEIRKHYKNYLKELINEFGFSENETMEMIQKWYNGYSWDGKNFVCNPFSILNLLKNRSFRNFWFETGTPTFLTKLIAEKNVSIDKYDTKLCVSADALNAFQIDSIDINVLLFQTGYLTIKNEIIDPNTFDIEYEISYPNKEVRDSFHKVLLKEFTNKDKSEFNEVMNALKNEIFNNNLNGFVRLINSLFSSIPYNIFIKNYESYYHTIIYLILKMSGIKIDCEVQTSTGRIDAIIKTDTHIYIMEFKMGKPDSALKQIKEMEYYKPYLADKRKIILVGFGFDKDKRNIDDFISEELKEKTRFDS